MSGSKRPHAVLVAGLAALVAFATMAIDGASANPTTADAASGASPRAGEHDHGDAAPGEWDQTTVVTRGKPGPGKKITGSQAKLKRIFFQRGRFHIRCAYSHSATNDPIVHFNHPGASHMHDFFANRSTNATTTAGTLAANSSTCAEGNNRTAYWVPQLRQGNIVAIPNSVLIYYVGAKAQRKCSGPCGSGNLSYVRKVPTFRMPDGFKMIAGQGQTRMRWYCQDQNGNAPKNGGGSLTIPTCNDRPLSAQVIFPSCWNGRNIDSPDHMSHVRFPNKANVCPAGFKYHIPELTLHVGYNKYNPPDGKNLITGGPTAQISSGAPDTMHADVMETWTNGRMETLLRKCINANRSCGQKLPY